ncbi:MAG: hypothetical protein Q4G25_03940 [Paracoccus sp. (in: a-proteobacteria)]|nr:hypothetical protein [Paracoccus sp. (in: a-proteobacteria)]
MRKASTSACAAQASQAAPDFIAGGGKVKRACANPSGNFLAKFVNPAPFLKHHLRGLPQLARDAHGILQLAQLALTQPALQPRQILSATAKQLFRDPDVIQCGLGQERPLRLFLPRIEIHCHSAMPRLVICPHEPRNEKAAQGQ